MGSDSDLPVMEGAYDALDELGFAEQTDFDEAPDAQFTYESYVVSAHRTPELMYAYGGDRGGPGARSSCGRGREVRRPPEHDRVARVPDPGDRRPGSGEVGRLRSSGCPRGAPIVAVDAGKSFNAALSAAQVLAREHDAIEERLIEYHEGLKGGVAEVSADLHDLGIDGFRERERAVVLAGQPKRRPDPDRLSGLLAGVFGDVGALR